MKKGLGKGLDALFADNAMDLAPMSGSTATLRLSQMEPDKNQPRKTFDPEKLKELSDSIRDHGLIQPIIVSPIEDGRFRIIAGERRWRACRMAGLQEAPVLIREYTPREISEISLIENLQREDLNPIEEAQGYRQLADLYDLTHEQIAATVSKDRAVISNRLRLLKLPDKIQGYLEEGTLAEGHARLLLAVGDPALQEKLAEQAAKEALSVRQLKALIDRAARPAATPAPQDPAVESAIRELEKRASAGVGNQVIVHHRPNNKGTVEIRYYSVDELEKIMEILEGGIRNG